MNEGSKKSRQPLEEGASAVSWRALERCITSRFEETSREDVVLWSSGAHGMMCTEHHASWSIFERTRVLE